VVVCIIRVWILGKGSWGPIPWRIRRYDFSLNAEILDKFCRFVAEGPEADR
jgi:hypothetical protein